MAGNSAGTKTAAAACEKELLIVEGAGHAQSQDKAPEEYYGAITRFLTAQGM